MLGFQRVRNAAALFKGHVSFAGFDFGVVALVNAGQHLHFDLRISLLFAELFHLCHFLSPCENYALLTYWK